MTAPLSSNALPPASSKPRGPSRGRGSAKLAEELRRQLADDIISGRMAPGIRLDEQTLASRFSVSRTPVREALQQLAAMGLATPLPSKGMVVATISAERLTQMFETMGELEALSARLAALRMTPGQRRDLSRLHEDMGRLVRAGDMERYDAANFDFHEQIYHGTGNVFLTETVLGVRNRLQPYRRAQFRVLGRLAKSFAEHGQIVEAILRADGDGAFAAMASHVQIVSGASADYLSSVRNHATPPNSLEPVSPP